MPAPKGTIPPNAGKGRVKGAQNKVTGDVKAMILAALDKAGGAEYLLRQADANPGAFMTLVGKVLPTQIAGDPNGVPVGIALSLEDKRAATKAVLDLAFGPTEKSE